MSANFPIEPKFTVRFFFANVVIRDAGSLADASLLNKVDLDLFEEMRHSAS